MENGTCFACPGSGKSSGGYGSIESCYMDAYDTDDDDDTGIFTIHVDKCYWTE